MESSYSALQTRERESTKGRLASLLKKLMTTEGGEMWGRREEGRTQLRTEYTDQALPVSLLRPGPPKQDKLP